MVIINHVKTQTQLAILEELASGEGPFLAGSEVSLADATAWPTVLFFRFMMPKFDKQDFMGPRLTAWCGHMESHPAGKRRAVEPNNPLLVCSTVVGMMLMVVYHFLARVTSHWCVMMNTRYHTICGSRTHRVVLNDPVTFRRRIKSYIVCTGINETSLPRSAGDSRPGLLLYPPR